MVLSIGGSITGRLTLSVAIPARTFEFLSASSYNGAIAIKDEVSAKEMALNAYNGGIACEGNFAKIFALSHNGEVLLYADAKSDIEIQATSHNGNVVVELQNIASNNISAFTRNGSTRNHFRGTRGGYTAYGRAESHNGNVTVK